jgi:hypothetical protein
VFFCNVALTADEKSALAKHARKRGIEETDVFDRERIRIVLDSPEGLSIRFQYLDLELSSAEQSAFFARWGSDIESLISSSFDTVATRLSRIEFFMERERPLTRLDFYLQFENEVFHEDLGHFRVDFAMIGDPPNTDLRWMHIGVCDDRDRRRRTGYFSNIVWKTIAVDKTPGETEVVVLDMHGVLETPVCEIRGSISNDFETIPIFDYKLGDLEGNPFAFFVTRKIASRIARILIIANEYVIFSSERDSLNFSERDYKLQWPLKFTEDELKEPWIRVMYEYDASRFNFSRYTPTRFFRPKTISLPKVDS